MQKLFIGIGVGPGLGASTAERFAQEGFDILLTNLAISGLGRSLRNEIFTDFDQRFLNQNTQRQILSRFCSQPIF